MHVLTDRFLTRDIYLAVYSGHFHKHGLDQSTKDNGRHFHTQDEASDWLKEAK